MLYGGTNAQYEAMCEGPWDRAVMDSDTVTTKCSDVYRLNLNVQINGQVIGLMSHLCL